MFFNMNSFERKNEDISFYYRVEFLFSESISGEKVKSPCDYETHEMKRCLFMQRHTILCKFNTHRTITHVSFDSPEST